MHSLIQRTLIEHPPEQDLILACTRDTSVDKIVVVPALVALTVQKKTYAIEFIF